MSSPESFGCCSCNRPALDFRVVQVTIGEVVKPLDPPFATDGDKVDGFFIPWLKPDRGSRWYVETKAERCGPVKIQLGVHLKEVEMRADLNGAVAKVANYHTRRRTTDIDLYPFFRQAIAAWLVLFLAFMGPTEGIVDTNELLTVRKHRLDHQHFQKRHDTRLNFLRLQYGAAQSHQF